MTGGSTGSGAAVTANVVPPPRITIQQTSAGGFGAVAISNEAGRYILTAAIAAAETKSQAKTISRPTIVTQNNVQGTVQQGSQIPIQTSINNTISIQYIAATLQLSVTPQVTEDGNIFLNVNVTNASPGPVLTSAGPSINTQSATTQVSTSYVDGDPPPQAIEAKPKPHENTEAKAFGMLGYALLLFSLAADLGLLLLSGEIPLAEIVWKKLEQCLIVWTQRQQPTP